MLYDQAAKPRQFIPSEPHLFSASKSQGSALGGTSKAKKMFCFNMHNSKFQKPADWQYCFKKANIKVGLCDHDGNGAVWPWWEQGCAQKPHRFFSSFTWGRTEDLYSVWRRRQERSPVPSLKAHLFDVHENLNTYLEKRLKYFQTAGFQWPQLFLCIKQNFLTDPSLKTQKQLNMIFLAHEFI